MNSQPPAAPAMPPPDLRAAMEAFRFGRMEEALTGAEAGIGAAADPTPYHAVASMAALRMRAPQRAIPHLVELLQRNPDDLATRGNLAKAHAEMGNLDDALALTEGASSTALLRIDGYVAQQRGDADRALRAYEAVLEREPDDSASLNNVGNLLAAMGRTDEAVTAFEHAITHSPREVDIYLNLADVLGKADRAAARLKVMKDVAAIAPDDRRVLTELALAHAHADEFDQALAKLEDVVERFPDFGESHIELGRLYEAFNRIDDLERLLNSLGGNDAPPETNFLAAWLAQRQGRFDDAAMLAAAIPASVHPMRRWHLVGSIEERRGNSAEAFAAFERMNIEALADAPPLPGPGYRASINAERARWTAEWAARWPDDPAQEDDAKVPIFLVGFPRSGTTLLDTMLMGLETLSVLEERPMLATLQQRLGKRDLVSLSADEIRALRKDYFAVAAQWGGDANRQLVDKHPLNMTRVPLIRRLFPQARIILSERHPYDVVLSCFMANFQLNTAMRSFTSLEETALTYDAVLGAWETATSLLQVKHHAVRYERLVVDAEAEMRPLVEWLGLTWSDALLDHTATAAKRGRVRTASYSQIGEPLYARARYRWKRYADQIAPVIPVLKPWADRLGYETE